MDQHAHALACAASAIAMTTVLWRCHLAFVMCREDLLLLLLLLWLRHVQQQLSVPAHLVLVIWNVELLAQAR